MGSSASSLPELLNENDFKNICGSDYNPIYYSTLKNIDGNVLRDFLILISSNSIEKEVFQLYLSFTSNGELDSKTFIKILKDTKSLNKNNFTSGDADLIFQKYKTKTGLKTLNYNIFRNNMIPDIVQKKGIDIDGYLRKLSQCEGPVLHATQAQANRFHDDKSTYTGSHAQGGPSFENNSGAVNLSDHLDRSEADVRGVVIKGEVIEVTDDHHHAAIKLQTVQRSKNAKKQVEALREIKQTAKEVPPDATVNPVQLDNDKNAQLEQLFLKFCTNSEIDSKGFVKLLKDCKVINKTFTTIDSDLIFQKTKAIATAPGAGSYSSGVVHGKRINFQTFYNITIPLIATKKNIEIANLIEIFLKCDGPSYNGVTVADYNRFHDDQNTYTGASAVAAGVSGSG